MGGFFDELEPNCEGWHLMAFLIRPIFTICCLFYLFYCIGYKLHNMNLISFYFSIYWTFHFIAGISQLLIECGPSGVFYKTFQNLDGLFSTLPTIQWAVLGMLMFYQNTYDDHDNIKYQGENFTKLLFKIWKMVMIIGIIGTQINFILFAYTLDNETIFFVINFIIRIPFVFGFVMSIVLFIKIPKDEKIDDSKKRWFHVWLVLFVCGPITWIIGSCGAIFGNYFWGHLMGWQFFPFAAIWLTYLESLKV